MHYHRSITLGYMPQPDFHPAAPYPAVKIAVIDESFGVASRIRRIVQDLAGTSIVGTAQDALNGAVLVRETRPDVVILDINLPGESGLALLREIKRAAEPPQVMVLTNLPAARYRQYCLEQGADFYLDKGYDFWRIAAILMAIMERKGIRHDIRWVY
jgi:DNA-binding NarL/FixJ family response regulator